MSREAADVTPVSSGSAETKRHDYLVGVAIGAAAALIGFFVAFILLVSVQRPEEPLAEAKPATLSSAAKEIATEMESAYAVTGGYPDPVVTKDPEGNTAVGVAEDSITLAPGLAATVEVKDSQFYCTKVWYADPAAAADAPATYWDSEVGPNATMCP